MILIFIGPPYAGKDTQGKLLSKELGDLPIFSMGHLIRKERNKGDEKFVKAYEDYSMKGLHLPTAIKFPLLKEKMEGVKDGFILDNFPATKDDLETFNNYLAETNKIVDRVIYLYISREEMGKRLSNRGRKDDDPDVIATRREYQGQDVIPVLDYYRSQNLLLEINGEGDIKKVYQEILKGLSGGN